jgi:ubiquitin-conjugating enzyme E2 M
LARDVLFKDVGMPRVSPTEVPCPADMSELNLSKYITINFPDGKEKMMHFEITIQPTEGLYK